MLQEDSSSSSEDVDYVPSDLEALSEEDESGEEEKEVTGFHLSEKKQRKQRKAGILPRKRKGGIQLEPDGLGSECNSGESDDEGRKKLIEEVAEESKIKEVEKEKEKAEALWASFLSDVGPQSKGCSTVAGSSPSLSASVDVNGSKVIAESNSKKNSSKENVRTISVTKVYDYAGEEVRVTKDVDINSKEAKMHLKKTIADTGLPQKDSPSTNSILGKRPRVSGGLGSILNKIGKKEKLSTLEKSKLDWDTFRKEEGIEDELKLHNKGKSSMMQAWWNFFCELVPEDFHNMPEEMNHHAAQSELTTQMDPHQKGNESFFSGIWKGKPFWIEQTSDSFRLKRASVYRPPVKDDAADDVGRPVLPTEPTHQSEMS